MRDEARDFGIANWHPKTTEHARIQNDAEPKLARLGTYSMMLPRRTLQLSTIPVLAAAASCMLDTTPIAINGPGPAGHDSGSAQTTSPAPAEDMTGSAEHDAAAGTPADAATQDAGVSIGTPPPPPTAASPAAADAGVARPAMSSMHAAGSTAQPAAMQCEALGSYGMHASFDVTWAATPWFDVGHGTVELYGVMKVDKLDAQTQRASGSFRVCGLELPALDSSALCSRYQLQLPASVWDNDKLPEQALEGSYSCDASHCSLRFSPASYALGIQLAAADAPWPALQDTTPAQFSDDDADGFPGVSVDVVSAASLASGQTACTASGGQTGSSGSGRGNSGSGNSGSGNSGSGNSGRGNSGSGNSGSQSPTTPTTTPALPMPTTLGRLPLGLRTQLTAALELAPDCQLREATGSAPALSLRSAGCFVGVGTDPASASSQCSEELRASFDQTLPRYDAHMQANAPGPAGKQPNTGTRLKVLRFAPGSQAGCAQVRSSMF